MSYRTILVAAAALTFVIAASAPVNAVSILFDDFDDDSGDLTGQIANTGQTWEEIPTRTALSTGTPFGQTGNGAGNDNSGGNAWKANAIPLDQVVNNGTVVISADYKKQHIPSPLNEMNLSLTSSTQNKTTALIWAADWLKIGGSWTFGAGSADRLNTSVPENIHVELTLNLVDGGTNTAEFSYEEIGNPVNSGSWVLPGSIEGTLNYDSFELWGLTSNGNVVAFDNVMVEADAAFLEADFNEDGDVDGDDFLIWQGGFNQFPGGDATKMEGDANADGFVDGNDFLVWQTQFGSGGGSASTAVPEPSTVALVLLAAVGVVFLRS